MIVTIVGAGRLAEGIAVRVLAGGHKLRLTDSQPGKAEALAASLSARTGPDAGGTHIEVTVARLAEAIAGADVVVLALPYPEGRQVARDQGAALFGTTVVDTCNPVDFSTFDSLLTSPGMSAAEEIAEVNPAARVVKAFNTTFQAALVAGQVGGLPLDVFLASDDPDAKVKVAVLVRDGGMRPIDTGPLRRARELEAFQLLHMTLQGPLGLNWSSAIKLLPLPGICHIIIPNGPCCLAPPQPRVRQGCRRGYREDVATTERQAGRLLSVNVGLPQDVSWHGRTVHTAVWKRPAAGPQMVRRLNIDGDGQGDLAGHGGEHRAVFVYQIESYRHWQDTLGRDDFEYGQFGENFTVTGAGLADDQVCIGDRYRIGEAVFEVTQPRVTCYRVGIRMAEPRMPALLVSHHRPGFYFRVLREGAVQAGDEIVQLATGPEAMTVAEADALLYLPGHSREQLLRALRIPALPDGWKASFQAMLDQPSAPDGAPGNAGLAAVSPPPAWPGFRPLAATQVERESDSVVSVYLADPGGAAVPAALPGQFLTLRLPAGPGGRPLLRSYSLSGPPGAATYRISVKREPHGAGSQFVHTRVRAGDKLDAAAPRGTFTLRPGQAPVLLISAGVGATPVLAMLHALAAAGSGRDIWWLHGARCHAEEPFAAESQSLLAALPRGHRQIWYSRPGSADVLGRDYQTQGRISAAALATLGLPRDADAYICGPAAFMSDVSAALVGLGVDGGRVHTEIFGAGPAITPGIAAAAARPPHPPAGEPGNGPQVAFARSDLTVPWDAGYASLLELAEACDVPVRWSCRTGVCHTCETGLVSGVVSYAPDPVDDPAGGSVLICCSQPGGDLVLDL